MPLPEQAIIDEVGVLVGEYEQFLSDKAKGTREAYLHTVRHLIGWLTQHPGHPEPFQPQQLTQTVVERYLAHLEQEDLSLCHRARVKSTISHFAQFLIEEKGLLRRNPTRGIDLPPVPLPAPQPLTPEQRSILRALVEQDGDMRGAAIFALGYWAGCRVSDVSWLRVADTHVGRGEGWLRLGCEGSKQRDIHLLNKAYTPLDEYLRATGGAARTYVFKSQRGERLTEEGIHHWFRMLKARATQDQWQAIQHLTFHDLRYDFAYPAQEAGWAPEKVASYLGLATRQGVSALQREVSELRTGRDDTKNFSPHEPKKTTKCSHFLLSLLILEVVSPLCVSFLRRVLSSDTSITSTVAIELFAYPSRVERKSKGEKVECLTSLPCPLKRGTTRRTSRLL